MNSRHVLLSAFPLLFGAVAAACGTSVVSGNQGGAGGTGTTSTTSSQVSSTATTSTTTTTTSSTTTSSSSSSGGGHIEPPPPPAPGQPAGTGTVTMAVTKLYMGNTDPDGTPDPVNGWKQYGFDLDGRI